MSELLGGYVWVAELADGTKVEQVSDNGDGTYSERSINSLHGKLGGGKLHLQPFDRTTHAPITFEFSDDDDFEKWYTRTFDYNRYTGDQRERPGRIDKVIFMPAEGPVYVRVYPNGHIVINTQPEP